MKIKKHIRKLLKHRNKFVMTIILSHLGFLIIIGFLSKYDRILFLISELLLILSVFLNIKYLRDYERPFEILLSAIDSIKEKDFNFRLQFTGNKELDQLIIAYNKMLEKLNYEITRKEEQHFFLEKLIDASPAGIIILDPEEHITNINPAAEVFVTSEENYLVGNKLSEINSVLAQELANLKSGETKTISISGISIFKVAKAHFFDKGFNHYFIILDEVAKEILKAEQTAYKKVIRMMSHEINNSIGAVNSILNSNLDFVVQLKESDREDFSSSLDVAIKRNESLMRFVKNFTDATKIPEPLLEKRNLYDVLYTIYILMNNECESRHIKWKWDLDGNEMILVFDVQLLEQVLVNIVKNAIEAIDKKGYIKIITKSFPHKMLIIRDSGCGIKPKDSKCIFSPFFSTKKNGQGIGLTLIREVLNLHGFDFKLESFGVYTDFTITFD